jgi:hypothetical protein
MERVSTRHASQSQVLDKACIWKVCGNSQMWAGCGSEPRHYRQQLEPTKLCLKSVTATRPMNLKSCPDRSLAGELAKKIHVILMYLPAHWEPIHTSSGPEFQPIPGAMHAHSHAPKEKIHQVITEVCFLDMRGETPGFAACGTLLLDSSCSVVVWSSSDAASCLRPHFRGHLPCPQRCDVACYKQGMATVRGRRQSGCFAYDHSFTRTDMTLPKRFQDVADWQLFPACPLTDVAQ